MDAWDHWFRWRNGDGLHDRTIDDTWWRVADAITSHDSTRSRDWAPRYVRAFSRWQLLPDERLLRHAGTHLATEWTAPLGATINVAAFVGAPLTRAAQLDTAALTRIAALAVRLLDDARAITPANTPGEHGLRIGLLGFADALRLLGIAYEDPRAIVVAAQVGTALAGGTLTGAVQLARDRPANNAPAGPLAALWRARGLPEAMIADALRHGVRYTQLTAITPQPRLARLANGASDALDPIAAEPRPADALILEDAQVALRAAIQPWIDARIRYPLATPTQRPWLAWPRHSSASRAASPNRGATRPVEKRISSPQANVPPVSPRHADGLHWKFPPC